MVGFVSPVQRHIVPTPASEIFVVAHLQPDPGRGILRRIFGILTCCDLFCEFFLVFVDGIVESMDTVRVLLAENFLNLG